jgi:hypothetical protein
MDAVRQLAQTVLYEGYILWPYRRSALKNRQRWTYGGLYPRAYSETSGTNDAWQAQTQCLLAAPTDTPVALRARFLHIVERRVARGSPGAFEFVDALSVAGERYLAWQEATEREVVGSTTLGAAPLSVPIDVSAGTDETVLCDADGTPAGAIVRAWERLCGALEISAAPVADGLFMLTAAVSNTTPWFTGREAALAGAFICTHLLLEAEAGEFASAIDPPADLRDAAAACRNVGVWPVLVGAEQACRTVLASPIILDDYPRVAPESPGDLFDGGEIDQLLVLNVLALTDEEKEEIRASDPRARELIERCAALTPEQLRRLHGTFRGPATVAAAADDSGEGKGQ